MPHFPLFLDISEQRVLIVGDTPEAKRKAQALAPFAPDIHFLSQLNDEALSPAPALVILTGENRGAEAQMCKNRNIPVNTVDDPDNCTFFFPSLICRGECTIGVSSGGTAPAASAVLRRQIEQALPEGLEEILPWLGETTRLLRKQIPDYARRAEVLAAISAESFQKNRPLTADEVKKYM